jgi:hypothetical protein
MHPEGYPDLLPNADEIENMIGEISRAAGFSPTIEGGDDCPFMQLPKGERAAISGYAALCVSIAKFAYSMREKE